MVVCVCLPSNKLSLNNSRRRNGRVKDRHTGGSEAQGNCLLSRLPLGVMFTKYDIHLQLDWGVFLGRLQTDISGCTGRPGAVKTNEVMFITVERNRVLLINR